MTFFGELSDSLVGLPCLSLSLCSFFLTLFIPPSLSLSHYPLSLLDWRLRFDDSPTTWLLAYAMCFGYSLFHHTIDLFSFNIRSPVRNYFYLKKIYISTMIQLFYPILQQKQLLNVCQQKICPNLVDLI